MPFVKRRRNLKRIRWAILVAIGIGTPVWMLVPAFRHSRPIVWSDSRSRGAANSIGELVGAWIEVRSQLYGDDPPWRADVSVRVEETVALNTGAIRASDALLSTRTFDVITIVAPYTLELKDRATGETVTRKYDPQHPIHQIIDMEWNSDGTAMRFGSETSGLSEIAFVRPGANFQLAGVVAIIENRAVPALLIIMLSGFIAALLTSERLWIRFNAFRCPNCNYDLRGNPEGVTGCAECGWNREGSS